MQNLSVGINYRSTIGSNGWSKNLERFLVLGSQQIRE